MVKHFDPSVLRVGEKRTTLIWDLDPVPTIYVTEDDDVYIPPSVLPTPCSSRKPPTARIFTILDETSQFKEQDEIRGFHNFTADLCPSDYSFQLLDGNAMYYKLEYSSGIPDVTEAIKVDQDLHVQLFYKGSPIPLPDFFRKGGDCKLKKKIS